MFVTWSPGGGYIVCTVRWGQGLSWEGEEVGAGQSASPPLSGQSPDDLCSVAVAVVAVVAVVAAVAAVAVAAAAAAAAAAAVAAVAAAVAAAAAAAAAAVGGPSAARGQLSWGVGAGGRDRPRARGMAPETIAAGSARQNL